MMHKSLLTAAVVLTSLPLVLQAQPAAQGGTWVDPETAAREHPDFLLQGEYLGDIQAAKVGLQVADLDEGKFLVTRYQGGLPGAGGDPSKVESKLLDRGALQVLLASGFKRVERVSPTMGKKAPEGARIIFAGSPGEAVSGSIKDGLLWPPAASTEKSGGFNLHVEFRVPFKPAVPPSSQDRGNSGIYIFDSYECQILDSFALAFLDKKLQPLKMHSDAKQWGGCLYKFKVADLNMTYPPLQWQTYDIQFKAAAFSDGKKTRNARLTLIHNGVVVHDDVELPKGTGVGASRPEKPEGTITFQGHGNPVAFRNIWLTPLTQ